MAGDIVDRIRYRLLKPEARRMTAALGKFDVVSFDIFDTLIKRTYSDPEKTFELVAERYARGVDGDFDCAAYCEKRKRAAAQAKREVIGEKTEEITLEDIYERIDYPRETAERLKQLEIDTEIGSTLRNDALYDVYRWCLESGRTVLIASDMYLPIRVIEAILANNGYDGYARLYLSSDCGVKKRTGSMFERIRKDYPDARIAHIGDSYHSDCAMARKHGIAPVWIPKNLYPARFDRKVGFTGQKAEEYGRIRDFINNTENAAWDGYYKYGYECLGPLLYGFASWLHGRMAAKGHDRVFFMSRDGYLMQKAYQALFPEAQAVYMYISRKSIHLPLYSRYDRFEDFLKLNGDKRWGLEMLCSRLGIDIERGRAQWKACGLDERYTFKAGAQKYDDRLLAFIKCFDGEIRQRSDAQFEAAERYLRDIGFGGNAAIVDSGGSYGTSQRCLERFCEFAGLEADLCGYYFWMGSVQDYNMEMYPFRDYRIVGGETIITEFALTSFEGTTKGYRLDGEGRAHPVNDVFEYADSESLLHIIGQIQEGALDFVRRFKAAGLLASVDPEVAYSRIKRISTDPTLRQAKMFGDIMFCSDGQRTWLARPKSWPHYLAHPGDLKYDFLITRWGIGFLKRLFVVKLPYMTLLEKLRSVYKSHGKQ